MSWSWWGPWFWVKIFMFLGIFTVLNSKGINMETWEFWVLVILLLLHETAAVNHQAAIDEAERGEE